VVAAHVAQADDAKTNFIHGASDRLEMPGN
jgi:hypothetical protein